MRGPTASTKNAVPFLLKLANLGGLRGTATTDALREKVVGQDVLRQLAAWLHSEIPETGVAHWQQHLSRYPANTPTRPDRRTATVPPGWGTPRRCWTASSTARRTSR